MFKVHTSKSLPCSKYTRQNGFRVRKERYALYFKLALQPHTSFILHIDNFLKRKFQDVQNLEILRLQTVFTKHSDSSKYWLIKVQSIDRLSQKGVSSFITKNLKILDTVLER